MSNFGIQNSPAGLLFPDGTTQSTAFNSGSTTNISGGFGQKFTSSGIFTVPAGVTSVKVTIYGAGGAGGAAYNIAPYYGQCGGGGGGGGAIAIGFVSGLTPGGTVVITVGAGGTCSVNSSGGSGGTTSFGTYITCTGGVGGTYGIYYAPYASGGTGGTVSSSGATMIFSFNGNNGGDGGPGGCGGYFGGTGGSISYPAVQYGFPGAAQFSVYADGYSASGLYQAGGGGASNNGVNRNYVGGSGLPGTVIVEW
jgi:hypothetical protein